MKIPDEEEIKRHQEKLEKQFEQFNAEAPIREIIKQRSIKYRGEIIDAVSGLDRMLDLYIATYFCDSMEKVHEFSNIILGANRISLDGKRKLFDVLIKIQRPNFFKIYKSFNKDMNTVMYERNSFAHNGVSTGSEAIERANKEIGLKKYSATPRIDWYTDKRVAGILKTVTKCENIISRMMRVRIQALRPPDWEPKFEDPAS